jgi:O-antigen/teichoic acid export membrane protein
MAEAHSRGPIDVKTSRLVLAISIAAIIVPVAASLSWEGVQAQPDIQVGFCSDLPAEDGRYLSMQLGIDPQFAIVPLPASSISATTLASVQVLVLANPTLNSTQASSVVTWVANGGSLLLVSGESEVAQRSLLLDLGCIDAGATVTVVDEESTVFVADPSESSVTGIEWSTAPGIKACLQISALAAGSEPILRAGSPLGTPILFTRPLGTGRVVVLTVVYEGQQNQNFQLWSYTPYFLFRIVSSLAGTPDIPGFAAWEHAPVPNTMERGLLVVLLAGIAMLVAVCILVAKKASKKPIRTNLLPVVQPDDKPVGSIEGQVIPAGGNNLDQVEKWERVGMHRQISSYFLTMLTQFAVNLPWLFLTIGVYSRYIQPFPMISGATSWIGTILGNVFVILDMAMGASMSKFFSHHRVRSPVTALKHAQVYAWWQFSIAAGQAFVIVSLATFVQPASYVGAISYFTILASASRIPGFFGVVGAALDAMQRFDVKIKANAILGTVVNHFVGWGFVLLFRAIYKDLPRFGEAFGAGVGMYLGGVVNGVINFCIFLTIYKKLGYYPGNLFRLDFGKAEFKEAFLFGFKLTIGNMWVALAGIIEILLISMFVLNYTEELAYYNLIGNLTGLGGACSAMTSALLPAISEAYNNDKKKLVEYYLIEGLKWVYFLQFFLCALFCAAGENFLLLSGSQWAGATKYLYWKVLFFAFWPFAWWDDVVFQGTGHSGYNTGVWFVEQGTRLALMPFTLSTFGLMGLVYAYIPGIAAKSLVSIIIVRRKVCAFKWQWMHVFLASALSALLLFGILFGIGRLFPRGDPVAGPIVFFGGFVLGLVAHGFLTGFFGGWDKNTIGEFARGIAMVRSSGIVFSPLQKAVDLGYRLSPWKSRFAVQVYADAEQEAGSLTLEKVAGHT